MQIHPTPFRMIGLVMFFSAYVYAVELNAQSPMNTSPTTAAIRHDKDHPWGFSPEFSNKAAWEARATALRQQVLVALGLWPEPPRVELKPVIHGRIDRDTYTIEKVFFASMPGHYVTGNLYRPKRRTGKSPAVLKPYGHWPDGRFIWRDDNGVNKDLASGAETDPIAARSPLQANCAMLARMGCVVFHFDMVGYADSTKIPHREGFTDVEAVLRCQSFMGLQAWNALRAMDFVTSLPEVDPTRIAVTGSSGGGTQTMILGAIDPRVAVAVPMVMVSMNMQGGCICENAPLYRVMTNNVEIASLFAPKPQGVIAANDWTADFMTRGLPEMKEIWALYGAEESLWGEHYNFGHNHNLHSRHAQYNFLNKHLKLGWPEPVKEAPFEPVHPSELSVYDDSHPRPADEADARVLRQYMTHTSDRQLAELAKNPEAHAKVMRAALEAMIVAGGTPKREVKLVQKFPEKWNGTIVLWATKEGKSALQAPDEAMNHVLTSGAGLVAVDPYTPPPAPARRNQQPEYAGYTLGYERAPLAEQVNDLVAAIEALRREADVRSVVLLADADLGPAAVLARAMAGRKLDRVAIDLAGFDFNQIIEDRDPRLLPGALKYGGIPGFLSISADSSALIVNAPAMPPLGSMITLDTASRDTPSMVDWLLKGS